MHWNALQKLILSIFLWSFFDYCSRTAAFLKIISVVEVPATGSTDSFWDISDKQLFMIEWHCIQKPVIFGILNSGNLCLINHLLLFWPNIASTAQDVQTCQLFWEKKSLKEHNVKQFSDFFSLLYEIFLMPFSF